MLPSISHRTAVAVPRRRVRSRTSFVLPRLLPIVLAALIALPIAEATNPVEAGKGQNKKLKTISRTFNSSGQIDIPAAGTSGSANPYPATIEVDAFSSKKYKKVKITDVNLILNGVEHQQATNVDVMLVHGGRRALVMADAGNSTDVSGLTIVLDDEAVADLPDGVALTSGTFRPGNQAGADDFAAPAPTPNGNVALSTFDGANPDGEWRLFIQDDAGANTGQLSGGWKLEITAKAKLDNGKKNKKKNKE